MQRKRIGYILLAVTPTAVASHIAQANGHELGSLVWWVYVIGLGLTLLAGRDLTR